MGEGENKFDLALEAATIILRTRRRASLNETLFAINKSKMDEWVTVVRQRVADSRPDDSILDAADTAVRAARLAGMADERARMARRQEAEAREKLQQLLA